MKNKILHPELCYRLTGVFFQIHRDLGRFCSERQYADAIENYWMKMEFLIGGSMK